MIKLVLISLLIFLTVGAVLTDYEQYVQMNKFIEIHSKIVADRPMVDRIMDSQRWITLHEQYGPNAETHKRMANKKTNSK